MEEYKVLQVRSPSVEIYFLEMTYHGNRFIFSREGQQLILKLESFRVSGSRRRLIQGSIAKPVAVISIWKGV